MSDTQKRTAILSAERRELLKKLKKQEGLASTVSVPPLKPTLRQEGELFPLSFAQQRLWILDQLDPDTPVYTVPLALHLTGHIHSEALRQALSEVMRRHEALRTAFVNIDGVPFQKIIPTDAFALPVTDLRTSSPDERQQAALRIVAEEAARPFDLASSPLLRARLLQLQDDEYILTITMHHIASDAWSVDVLYQEMMTLYGAFLAGHPSPLSDLPVQYIDYALWQRQWLQGETLERQIDYWKKQLSGLPALLPLPTDRPRPAVQTFRGATHSFRLPPTLTSGLKALAQRIDVTLFMTLLAAFQVLLSRHTNQEDIAVGTPIANRPLADLERMIGFFLNTIVLRSDLSGNPSFLDLLKRVRSVTLDAFSHRELPFEMVVEALQVERDLSYSPLFQTLFTLQSKPSSTSQQAVTGFGMQPLAAENTVAKFDLLLDMAEEDQEGTSVLTGNFEYNCDLFDASTIDRFAQRFLTLLAAIVEHPEQRLDTLPWFPAVELEQVTHIWNSAGTGDLPGRAIHHYFEAQAACTPERLALVVDEQELSYGEVERRANQLAHVLRRQGVGPEIVVGLCVPRSPDLLIAVLAILKAGGTYLPLDPTYPVERLHSQVQDAQAQIIITVSELAALWKQEGTQLLLLDTEHGTIAQESEEPLHGEEFYADQLAYVIYTSGSTGRPKGVGITHRNAEALISWGRREYSPLDLSGVLAGTSLCFDLSVFELFVTLSSGGTIYLVENGLHLPQGAQREHITLLNTVPSVMHELLHNNLLPTSVRVVNLAGEALPGELAKEIYQHSTVERVYNLYGPTEDTTYSTGELVGREESGKPAIGRSLDHRQVYVLDKHGEPLPIGVPGEIYLGGAGVTRGYLHQPALTAERYIPNPFSTQAGERLYKTGDLAYWSTEGKLIYLGRNDHQVKLHGFRIEPGEIEQRLTQHPEIDEAAVQVWHDPANGQQSLVASIVPCHEILSTSELRTYLQQSLPDYLIPTLFISLDALPRTMNGKVDRNALPEPKMAEKHQHGQGPRNPQEQALADIWKQVLGHEAPGIRANFFEVGGHSLLAIQIISRIRAVFQVELPLRRLFEMPTIEGLGKAITALSHNGQQQILEPPITRAPRSDSGRYAPPISYAQQRLWILDRLSPGKTAYTMSLALHISGSLNRAALEQSLREIVTRHAVLRTTFPILHDTPVQSITPATEYYLPIPFIDLSSQPVNERVQTIERRIAAEAGQPFDLVAGPLLRVQLIHADDTNHVLLLTMHHIISDGWSLDVLKRELSTLYRAFSNGQASPLPALPVQYADYAIWQRQWLQVEEVLERQLHYWKKQLAGAPDVLPLPTDRPRGAVQSFRSASHSFTIPPALTSDLKQLARGSTLFIVLLAAFQTFLSRFSNQEDIVVGTPIANRTHTEIEDLIGFFVNTLVLRTDLSGRPSFLDVVQRVRRVVLDALTHQDLPFEQIVEAVQPERNLLRSPLFQVMFLLQNAPQDEIDFSPLSVSSLDVEQTTTKFDLTLAMTQRDGGLEGEFEYNTDLFEPETIARFATHFQVLLAAIVQAPEQPVETLPLLSPTQYQQIVVESNTNDQEYSCARLIFELVEDQAARSPEAPALSERGVKMSYGELNKRANQLAHYLQSSGIQPGSTVGVYMQRNLHMVVALLATLKLGAAYLPLDATTPPARAAFILDEARVALLITQKDLASRLPDNSTPTFFLEQEQERLQTQQIENLPRTITPDYPAYIIYTSGSTGRPKGVIIEHKALLNMVGWYQQAYQVTEQDKTTHLANLGFDAAVFELWPYLAKGATVYLVDEAMRLSPMALMPWLVKQGITICFLPTSQAEIVINRSWPAQTKLRLLLTGGDQLHRVPSEHLPFTLMNQYGPTENTVVTTCTPVPAGQRADHLPAIGRPVTNTQVYVLNRAGEPQPIGVPGELFIGGQSLAQGYLNRPDLTAVAFVPDPFSSQPGARLYKTGDIVQYQPDGNLEFLGRLDHQVKIRGFRIELGEIEAVLTSHPDVREAIVVISENMPGEKRLAAYVILHDGTAVTREVLQRLLKERLPDYMVPTSLSIIEAFPLTPHGKVDRRALAARRPIHSIAQETYIAPRDTIELQLVHLWEKLLGVSPIGVTDNFFTLGGHSLAGVRLMSQIQRTFGMDLPLSTLFEGATITSLAKVLRQQEEQITSSLLVEIQPTGSNPPLFCIHPSGGEVLCYITLAHHLGTDQPVYGLQASHLYKQKEEQTPTLEEMAASYIAELRTVQQEGPYFLSGWSMGGVVAFEMARQLEAQGQQIAFLGLIDSHLPSRSNDDERSQLTRFINDLAGTSNMTFAPISTEETTENTDVQLEHLLLDAQSANVLPPSVDATYIKGLFSTFKKNLTVLSNYQPRPYAGQLTLFQASAFTSSEQVEITYGWHRFAATVDANHALPGDHYTILRDPNVEILAEQLRACIKQAQVEPALSSATIGDGSDE